VLVLDSYIYPFKAHSGCEFGIMRACAHTATDVR
jgi:hypothetical protein